MTTVYDIELGDRPPALEARDLTVDYGAETIVRRVSFSIPAHRVVALVGPSGSGKTTLLKSFNRMNDLSDEARIRGQVLLNGRNIYAEEVDPADVRRRVGMVFQRPNPFPQSVFENVAFGPKVNRMEGDVGQRVERALRKAALWDEVSDRLFQPANRLNRGQQQLLCIARALAVEPEVLLMDEPASELDPGATLRIEELLHGLKEECTILFVTNNMQQAARVSDFTAFFSGGELVEYGPTSAIFTNPREPRTEAYVTGRMS